MDHDERLRVPWSWHLAGVAAAAVFGSYPAAYTNHPVTRIPTYLLALLLVEVALWLIGRPRVRVGGGLLEAGDRRLPLAGVLHAEVVPDVRRALRPGVCAVVRPWVPTGVLVESAAGRWVVSSRRPADLVTAVTALVGPPAEGRLPTWRGSSADHGSGGTDPPRGRLQMIMRAERSDLAARRDRPGRP